LSFAGGASYFSSSSPVAILITFTALPMTLAGRFSPLGPRGISKITLGHTNGVGRSVINFYSFLEAGRLAHIIKGLMGNSDADRTVRERIFSSPPRV